MTQRQRLNFVKRKLEILQEFGNVEQYREAWEELKKYKVLCASELKAEAKKRQELGMISHKKSLITIFGHKQKIKNLIQKT